MPDWEERISNDTNPAIRVEHDLRYRLVAPLIGKSQVWADLGCGNGTAAATALGGEFRGRAVLIDADGHAVEGAAETVAAAETVPLVGDLSSPETLERVAALLLEVDGRRTTTCFEVVEHLETFVPLIGWAVELARVGSVTFVMSVPNDAFWAIENPYHRTAWGEGAFAELRSLLPPEHVVLCQVALAGSTIQHESRSRTDAAQLAIEPGTNDGPPTHFIVAIGPDVDDLADVASVAHADALAQRQFERKRESDLAYLRTVDRENADLVAQVRKDTAEFDAWRAYIRRLEADLGIPPPEGEVQTHADATTPVPQRPE